MRMDPSAKDIAASLKSLRLNVVGLESHIHDAIAQVFDSKHWRYEHEAKIGPRCRVDFLLYGVAVEVKKHKPNSGPVIHQLRRYAACEPVSAIVLVVERNIFSLPTIINGKPVHLISLSANWGVAL